MKISIFGIGYVGLVSGVCLANTGNHVYCIDKNEEKIKKIKKGISPIYEPGLDELLKRNLNNITPTTNPIAAIKDSQVIIIAVGTPFDGKHIDLSYVKQAAKEIGELIKETDEYKVIVVKSTVVPETTMKVVRPIVLKKSGKSDDEIGFAMNPEFLREGHAVEDFSQPDRIVLGVTSKKAEKILKEIYNGYSDATMIITNPTTAEMIKYTANSFLALLISYANEIARICEKLPGVDSEEVFNGVILDKRFSPVINGTRITPQLSAYLRAGIGFGGSCFPKDVKALHAFSEDNKVAGYLLKSLLQINKTQLEHVFSFGINNHNGKIEKIAILGTAFKPNTDDIREAPGIKLAQIALNKGIKVCVHDYIALQNTKDHFGSKIEYFDNPLDAIKKANIIFVTTIWPQYHSINDEEFERCMRKDAIMIDTRSHFKDRKARKWRYRIGVGK